MSLKAVLFDFNGVIINDESIHEILLQEVLIEENLLLKAGEFRRFGLGRSDWACFQDLLRERGRFVNDDYIHHLVNRKATKYYTYLQTLEVLPIYADTVEFLAKLQELAVKMAIVTGAILPEVTIVLERAGLANYFELLVTGEDIKESKPAPDGYLLALERLKARHPDWHLQASECLAIEDTYVGIIASKQAGIPVLGIAHTYPLHFIQRWADWAIDSFADVEWERFEQFFDTTTVVTEV